MGIETKIHELLTSRLPDYSLPQEMYTNAEVYDFDLHAIFRRHWLQVSLDIEIPSTGDWITVSVGRSSIIILRDEKQKVRAYFNTCRHRGAKVCPESSGHAKRLVCPYHQWVYDLSGRLTRAPGMPAELDLSAHPLKEVAAESIGGIIYVCLAEDPPDIAPFRDALEPLLEPYNLRNGKLAHTAVLVEAANWKLVMENARECYHCKAKHPELMRTLPDVTGIEFGGKAPDWLAAYWKRCETLGLKTDVVHSPWFNAMRYPLLDGVISMTVDGKPAVRKPLTSIGDGDIGGMRWAAQPNCFNHVFGDYALLFQVLPSGPQQTIVTAKWIVNRNAVEGVDYDLGRLIEVWDATNNQDRWLSENNQAGVNSLAYLPGPYSPREGLLREFVDWYCKAAAEPLPN